MVRREVIAAKAGRARARLNDAAPVFGLPQHEFLGNASRRDLALFYLFLAIQECVDMAAHRLAVRRARTARPASRTAEPLMRRAAAGAPGGDMAA